MKVRGLIPKAKSASIQRSLARAFTLIELLLAMVLVGLVLAAVSSVFFGAFGLRQRTQALVDDGLPIQRALEVIRRDLAGLVQPGGVLSSNLITDASSLSSVSGQRVSPPLYTGTGAIRDFAPWADIQCVTYYLRPPTNRVANSGLDLVRMLNRNLLPVNTDIPEEQWLMTGVERMEFSYYDGTQWKLTWNSTNDLTLLPKAVKVEIQLAPPVEVAASGIRRNTGRQAHPKIQLISPVILTAVTNQNSTAGGMP